MHGGGGYGAIVQCSRVGRPRLCVVFEASVCAGSIACRMTTFVVQSLSVSVCATRKGKRVADHVHQRGETSMLGTPAASAEWYSARF